MKWMHCRGCTPFKGRRRRHWVWSARREGEVCLPIHLRYECAELPAREQRGSSSRGWRSYLSANALHSIRDLSPYHEKFSSLHLRTRLSCSRRRIVSPLSSTTTTTIFFHREPQRRERLHSSRPDPHSCPDSHGDFQIPFERAIAQPSSLPVNSHGDLFVIFIRSRFIRRIVSLAGSTIVEIIESALTLHGGTAQLQFETNSNTWCWNVWRSTPTAFSSRSYFSRPTSAEISAWRLSPTPRCATSPGCCAWPRPRRSFSCCRHARQRFSSSACLSAMTMLPPPSWWRRCFTLRDDEGTSPFVKTRMPHHSRYKTALSFTKSWMNVQIMPQWVNINFVWFFPSFTRSKKNTSQIIHHVHDVLWDLFDKLGVVLRGLRINITSPQRCINNWISISYDSLLEK